MSYFDTFTVEQIAELLDDAADVVKATIYIEPPQNALLSDGDSDDDDPTCDINKLSGNQLRAGAELVCETITKDGIEINRYGGTQDIDDDEVPGTPEPTPTCNIWNISDFIKRKDNNSANQSRDINVSLQDMDIDKASEQKSNKVAEILHDWDINEEDNNQKNEVDGTQQRQNIDNVNEQQEENNIFEDPLIVEENPNERGMQGPSTSEVLETCAVVDKSVNKGAVGTGNKKNFKTNAKQTITNTKRVKKKSDVNEKPTKKVTETKKRKIDGKKKALKKKKVERIRKWEKRDIPDTSVIEFERPSYLQKDFTPLECFELFFSNDVIEYIVECTNEFAVEKGNHNYSTTADEIRLYFAILLLSGYNVLPRRRMYWESSEDVHNSAVSKAMSRNRFEEIMSYIHFCKNAEIEKSDRFGKVRPVWNMLNELWLRFYPGDVYLSVDESMVPYYGRYGAKQHIHGKPIRFGYKVWVLATRLGYIIQGEPYQGKNTGTKVHGLGAGGSVVVDLLSELPQNKRYCVFFDNFFTSFRLLEVLKSKGHDGTGTVRVDRIENAPLPGPKLVEKEPRGSYHQLTDNESNITLVRYNDNNVFTMASTVAGVHPLGKAKRWSNEHKKHIHIDQPACVILYNTYMGGVDRMDENIASYRINIRSKKWYWPMISYMLSVSMNNAWFIYRLTPKGHEEKLDFLGFIRYVVKCYMAKYTGNRATVGRPSSKASSRVPEDVRYSGNHFLETSTTQIRCAHCSKATRKMCTTCQVGCHVLCGKLFHTR